MFNKNNKLHNNIEVHDYNTTSQNTILNNQNFKICNKCSDKVIKEMKSEHIELTTLKKDDGISATNKKCLKINNKKHGNSSGNNSNNSNNNKITNVCSNNNSSNNSHNKNTNNNTTTCHSDKGNTNDNKLSKNYFPNSNIVSRRKVARMLICVVLLFFICYLPILTYNILRFVFYLIVMIRAFIYIKYIIYTIIK